jgi:hypothetical protein
MPDLKGLVAAATLFYLVCLFHTFIITFTQHMYSYPSAEPPDLDPTPIQGSAFQKMFHPYPDLDSETEIAAIRKKNTGTGM